MLHLEIIIPAWKEQANIGTLITSIENQIPHLPKNIKIQQIHLITHDKETGTVGKNHDKLGLVKHSLVPRSRGGKIASINHGIKNTKADLLIFMDGDIKLNPDAIIALTNNIVHTPQNTGAVAGRPVSLNSTSNMLGFWAYVLTTAVHKMRQYNAEHKLPVNLSGNLYAIWKKALPPKLPKGSYDDAFISFWVQANGYIIGYEPNAKAYQYFPKNYQDWLIQKRRNIKGEYLTKEHIAKYYPELKEKAKHMRNFKQEVAKFYYTLNTARTAKQWVWLALLYLARLHLWTLHIKDRFTDKSQDPWKNWKKV